MPLTATQTRLQDNPAVLVASSNAGFRQRIMMRLRQEFSSAEEAEGGADALARMEMLPCNFVLIDTRLADLDPLEIAGLIRATTPQVEVLMFDSESAQPLCPGQTSQAAQDPSLRRICEILERDLAGYSAAESTAAAADSVIIGVSDEMPSVILAESAPRILPGSTTQASSQASTRATARIIKAGQSAPATPLPGMIGESEAMSRVYRMARLVARRPTTVLLTGESGTGKELVAHALHEISPRAAGPYVTVNCAAIPESLMESELFGHQRGAFTGAVGTKIGRVSAAQGGTLFLDEIGELALNLQSKLLRFLQAGEVQRLGSSDMIRVETRVVAATNADLLRRVKEGSFRQDLYYRLAVFPIELPPLKDREGDVTELAKHFLSAFCRSAGQSPKTFTAAALGMLQSHSWPGNVRELQHTVERACILADEDATVDTEHLLIAGGEC